MSGIKIATAHSHAFQSGAFSFMPCTSGRESLPLEENDSPQPMESKSEGKKKKFHPLRNLRRMFRRKGRRSSISAEAYQVGVGDNPDVGTGNLEQRSCSTSRLQEENSGQSYMGTNNSRLNPGLSLSHDSIFTPERADSGLSSSDLGNSSLSITVLTPPSRECATKSQQSSCSETSLLSLGSSEVDELSPVRSKKLSDLDVGVTSYKLSHSAAKHKMAVKPRRNHGAPRTRRKPMFQTSISPLPITIEVNEEKILAQTSPSGDGESDSSPRPNTSRDNPEKVSLLAPEDDHQGAREEGFGQRTESFFGRFLSRRSEKKKKPLQTPNANDPTPEDKSGSLGKRFGRTSKSPNRRQRVEPMEIPSTTTAQCDYSKQGNPASPSHSNAYWPTEITSRSMSPPKSVWPDTFPPDQEPLHLREGTKVVQRSPSQPSKDPRNPDLMRELTNSISVFAKDDSTRRKRDEPDDQQQDNKENVIRTQREEHHNNDTETVLRLITQDLNPQTPGKTIILLENQLDGPEPSPRSRDTPSPHLEVLTIQINSSPDDLPSPRVIPSRNQTCPEDGPDASGSNKISEDETQTPKCLPQERKDPKETEDSITIISKSPERETLKVQQLEDQPETPKKTEPEPPIRLKPVISKKPKDLKRVTNAPFLKSSNPKTPDAPTGGPKSGPETELNKTSPNFIQKRKSELMSLSETLDKDRKSPPKPLIREPSFKDPSETEPGPSEPLPKTESNDQVLVVLRRKTHAGHSEDQPELMKVFARRSLKIRETEKVGEKSHRSRDSDKENDTLDSPKEERKKPFDSDEIRDDQHPVSTRTSTTPTVVAARPRPPSTTPPIPTSTPPPNDPKVHVTPLKPELTANKNLPKYTRSLSENNASKHEPEPKPAVLEENKMNNLARRITDMPPYRLTRGGKGEDDDDGEEDQRGFKRIQQRKAEWEMRAQQSAK